MKIPNKLLIAGIEWTIKMKEILYVGTNDVVYGHSWFNGKLILIAEKKQLAREYKKSVEPITKNEQIQVLFHEIWHSLCLTINLEDINNEQNADMFGYLCGNSIFENYLSINPNRKEYLEIMVDATKCLSVAKLLTNKELNTIRLIINCIVFNWNTEK